MTKIDLTTAEAKTAREALRAYAGNLDTQLRNVRMSPAGLKDATARRDAAKSLLERIPAPKARKPRKPASE